MDAERIAHAAMAHGKRGDRRKIEGTNRRHHDAGHTRRQGRIDHVIPVRLEFGGIEVAVGIDEHRLRIRSAGQAEVSRPSRRARMRSARCASSRSWVTITKAVARSRLSCSMSSNI